MRELTLAECDYVAGGNVTNLSGITVTHPGYDDYPYAPWDPNDGVGPGGGSSGGGDGDNDEEVCPGGPTPNGETPAGYDIGNIRAEAQEGVDKIQAESKSYEHGVVVYSLNGELQTTRSVTQNSNSQVGFPFSDPSFIPTGAHVIGWIHSHPDLHDGVRQDTMSEQDDDAHDTFTDNANGRFTVDAALMTYVIDNKTGKVYEFNRSDRDGARGQALVECTGG